MSEIAQIFKLCQNFWILFLVKLLYEWLIESFIETNLGRIVSWWMSWWLVQLIRSWFFKVLSIILLRKPYVSVYINVYMIKNAFLAECQLYTFNINVHDQMVLFVIYKTYRTSHKIHLHIHTPFNWAVAVAIIWKCRQVSNINRSLLGN